MENHFQWTQLFWRRLEVHFLLFLRLLTAAAAALSLFRPSAFAVKWTAPESTCMWTRTLQSWKTFQTFCRRILDHLQQIWSALMQKVLSGIQTWNSFMYDLHEVVCVELHVWDQMKHFGFRRSNFSSGVTLWKLLQLGGGVHVSSLEFSAQQPIVYFLRSLLEPVSSWVEGGVTPAAFFPLKGNPFALLLGRCCPLQAGHLCPPSHSTSVVLRAPRSASGPSAWGSSGCSTRAPPAGQCFCAAPASSSCSLWRLLCLTGGSAARPRSAARCTASNTGTSGARPAAGRRPASASWTEEEDEEELFLTSARSCFHFRQREVSFYVWKNESLYFCWLVLVFGVTKTSGSYAAAPPPAAARGQGSRGLFLTFQAARKPFF